MHGNVAVVFMVKVPGVNRLLMAKEMYGLFFSLPLFPSLFCGISKPSSRLSVPLERGNNDNFRAREARAARLASEIESSPQYRHRVSLENDDGKTEEDKYSAVVRDAERERGRESPRDRERGRDSPSGGSR